jgi:hypothetical protein
MALSAHGIRKRREPVVGPAIRCHDDRSGAIALERQVIEVATLDGIEGVDGEIVEDEEVDGHEFPQLGFVAVIEPCVLEGLEHLIRAHGEHGGTAPTGDVPEGPQGGKVLKNLSPEGGKRF